MRAGATLDLLFTDLPLPERIRAAASAGFAEVEILRPYGADLRALRRALDETGLGMALVNTPFGEGADAIGHAALPGASATFRRSFRAAVGAARALRARQIHVLCGRARGREADLAFVHNLAWAAALAPDLTLTLEPLNPQDQPGYFLGGFDQAAALLDLLDMPNVALQFDAYHAFLIAGDVAAAWAAHGARAAHVQISDAPGRGPPGTGEAGIPAFLDRLAAEGWAGTVSGEYAPGGPTGPTLGWLAHPGFAAA